MKKKLLILIALFAASMQFAHSTLVVDMKNSVSVGGNYYFPNLTVTGNASDRGYMVRFMFTRPTITGDAIVLPVLPGGWTQNAKSTEYVRMIDISAGATAIDLQNFLRKVQVQFAPSKLGQEVRVLISETATDARRRVYYSSEIDHWYEYVPSAAITWTTAYNQSLDKTFMGMTGYLATVTSSVENTFINTLTRGALSWLGGTRMDIRPVQNSLTGKLTANPSTKLLYWYWSSGPEWVDNGRNPTQCVFFNKTIQGGDIQPVTVRYPYQAWSLPGEPNNDGAAGEYYTNMIGYGSWNDLDVSVPSINGYVVEYQGSMTGPFSSGVVGFEVSKLGSIDGVNGVGTAVAPIPIFFGDVMSYFIEFSNSSRTSIAVRVFDTIPAGLELVAGSISVGGVHNPTFNSIEWNVSVPLEGNGSVSFKAKPSAGSTNLLENKAYVQSNVSVKKQSNSTFHQAKMCNITFAAGANGTIANGNPQTIDYSQNPLAGVTATPNSGYSFIGWSYPAYTSLKGAAQPAAGSGIMDYTTISVLGNIALTANFSIETYNIVYTLNGGAAVNPTTYQVTTPAFTLNNPTRSGYDFAGWTGSNGGTQQTTVSIPLGSTGHKNYEAHWTAVIPYTITYDYDGGTAPAIANPAGYNITQTPLSITNEPTRDGYTFDGWIDMNAPLLPVQKPINIAAGTVGDLSYKAKWTPIGYTLTYNYNGGVAPVIPNPTGYNITQTPLSITNEPTQSGYTFIGWTGSNGSTPQTTVTLVANTFGDKSYTANWSTDAYTISYDYNGGTAPATANKASYNITDTPFNIPNQPTRDGYTFAGWTGSNGATPQSTVNVIAGSTGDLSYQAQWTPISYPITYNYASGVGPVIANPANYDISQTPFNISNPPTRGGYTFTGWTGSNGVAQQLVVNVVAGTFGSLAYTANWSLDTYPIHYDYNSGNAPATANPSNYDVTQTPFSIANQPTRNGYGFDGWTGSNGAAPQTTVNVAGGTNGALSYQAQWTLVPYTITYNLHGGTPPGIANPTSYDITTVPLTIANQPTKVGHTFVGWTGSNGIIPQTTVQVTGNPMQNLAYDAKWSFQFALDTVFASTGPVKLESGHDGLSYVWVLPDGSTKNTPDVMADVSGRYILRTNYGSMVIPDTVYVLLFFDDVVQIKRLSTTDAKVGQEEKFVVTLNKLITNATFTWNFPTGTPVTSVQDTSKVVFNTTGRKTISVDVTVTKGALVSQKTFTYALDVHATGRGFFVDKHVAGGLQNGSSWTNAYKTIQEALKRASSGDYIWVAKGEYKPEKNSSYFIVHDSIQIYGGFAGWESYLYERNYATNQTIMKGNGSSVVVGSNIHSSGRIDGFIIEGGTATKGAGVYNDRSSLTLANCIIRGNRATDQGGGIYSELGDPILYNVEISGNTAKEGAGMYNASANAKLTNVTISGNQATNTGGGISNSGSNPFIYNTILWDNRSDANDPNVSNVSSQPSFGHSLVEGSRTNGDSWNSAFGIDLGNNSQRSPLFRKPGFDTHGIMVQGNYYPSAASAALDKGSNRYVYAVKEPIGIHLASLQGYEVISGFAHDLAYLERMANGIVDMGAYEYDADQVNPDIQREVTLPQVEGLVTNPKAGIYTVKGRDNFTFTVTALPGYSLDHLKVVTGIDRYDKEGIFMDKNADGSVTVTIMQVTHALNLSINGVTTTGKEGLDAGKVWASEGRIYVQAEKEAILKIYTIAGQLYQQLLIHPGQVVIPVEKGVYNVQVDQKVHKVIVK